jgi:hypothetical protein
VKHDRSLPQETHRSRRDLHAGSEFLTTKERSREPPKTGAPTEVVKEESRAQDIPKRNQRSIKDAPLIGVFG